MTEEDQVWLNRHLLEAAFRQATGQRCFRRLNSGLDGVLVSDVGKPFEVQSSRRRRADPHRHARLRHPHGPRLATGDRDVPGHARLRLRRYRVVEPAEDPTALHPEVQRQAAHIRTDLDRFSHLEISSLVRHGYCVGRKACRVAARAVRRRPAEHAPWDPIPGPRGAAPSTPRPIPPGRAAPGAGRGHGRGAELQASA